MKDFSLICAVALNGVIGESETNTIPWYLPLDLKHFKSVTMGKTVVMGSRTFRSIGKALPGRQNVVITRNAEDAVRLIEDGANISLTSFAEVMRHIPAGFMVIGGAHIYGEALRYQPSRLFITIVKINAEGDVRFPISGYRFQDDRVLLQSGEAYVSEKRSAWFKEYDVEYQFTEFALRLS
jgi:dihydrofolate reductase